MGREARSFAFLMKKRGEARRAAREAVDEIPVEETDDVAAACLAVQWRECPGTGLDDGSLTSGTLVEADSQSAFGGAQFGRDSFDGLKFGNVDGRGQARKEWSFGPVGNRVRKVVGQRANDTGAVWSREEHWAAAAPGDVGAVNKIAIVERVNSANPSGEK